MSTFRRALVALLSLTLLAGLFALGAATPVAAEEPGPDAPTVTGEGCAPGVGVTVVVDFQQLGQVEVGCAPGQQADGFAALTNAGFTFNEDAGAVSGTICQIRSLPSAGFPSCWYEGFWGYWKSNGAQDWQWSQVGAADGPLPVDSVEGWSWTSPIPEDYSGAPMRLSVADAQATAPEPMRWASVSTGAFRTCGITTDGEAWCWGADGGGLGNGTAATVAQPMPTPVETPTGVVWAAIDATSPSTAVCGVSTAGAGYCWGSDTNGLLGNGAGITGTQVSPSPVEAPAGVTWRSITVGQTHACGVTTDGAGYCWGADTNGRLGNGTALTAAQVSPSPVEAPAGVTWASISAGRTSTCGITTDGAGYCWGADTNGRLGNGATLTADQPAPSPVDTPAGVAWASVSVGWDQACARTTTGTAWCWGDDAAGVLGNGPDVADAQASPTAVLAPAGVAWAEVESRRVHACALSTDGDIYCWGNDANGALGNGPDLVDAVDTPTLLTAPEGAVWTDISTGISTCAVRADATAWCWGQQNQGGLGNGSTASVVVPSPGPVLPPGQVITFADPADVTLPTAPVTLAATASSGLPVTYTTAGGCSVEGATLTYTDPGTCTVTATQGGAGRWPAARPVTQEVTVGAPIPLVTITGAPTGIVPETTATITFTVDDPEATVEYRLDEGAWLPAASPLTLSDLPSGPRALTVRATGVLGGVGTASVAWRVRGDRDCLVGPRLPDLGIVDSEEVLPVSMDDGYAAEVAVLTDLTADPATATYAVSTQVPLAAYEGQTVRIVARRADTTCPDAPTFDATYDVATGYPTVVTTHPGYPGDAVHYEDERIVAWGTEYEHYFIGPNVGSTPFENPPGGQSGTRGEYGCCTLLGDHGRVDLVFDDAPVTNGDGTDFAVYENGFLVNGTDGEVFIELARIQVSSDGEHWAEFDTASRIPEPIGGYGYAKSNLLGHLAGSHPGPYGTAFDLENLRNTPEVRAGQVDLASITRIRVIDVVGDGHDLDSFGRPIYDAWPTYGTGGYDFSGLAVLNHTIRPATIEVTSSPAAFTSSVDATVEFTVAPADAAVECRLDEDEWAPCSSPVELTGLAEGGHSLAIRATRPGAEPSTETVSWTVDTAAPVVEITDGPDAVTNQRTATIAYTVDDDTATVEYRVGAGDWVATTGSPIELVDLWDGDDYTVEVRATDAAGHVGSDSIAWTIDDVAPELRITGSPGDPSPSRTNTFAFDVGDDAAVVECRATEAAGWASCTSPWSGTVDAEGPHVMTVRAVDAVGNEMTAEARYSVDTVAPAISITEAPDEVTVETTATFVYDIEDWDGVTFVDCRIDGGDWAGCQDPIEYSGLAVGEHTFEIRATDRAHNVGTDAHTWTVVAPRTANEAWVWAAYEDFLDREPTPSELSAAVARLDGGTPRSTLARELATSDEWLRAIVTRFYVDTLGRQPDAAGLAYWTGELRLGRKTVAQVAAGFYAAPEYFSGIGGGTTTSWVTDLYGKLLDRQPDAEGLTYWTGQVSSRGRTWVALQMYQSLESRRARVTGLYQSLLGRAPDGEGRDYWAGRLTKEGDIALARSLASSGEYLTRAQRRFP